MGDTVIHTEATEQEVAKVPSDEITLVKDTPLSTYSIIAWPADKLPKEYLPLIFAKWLRSLRFGNPMMHKIPSDKFYSHYHDFIEKLLHKPDCIVRLAVLSDDHDVVLGFAVSREDVLDYIHVHGEHRKTGIGEALMPNNITTFTHITGSAMAIWQYNKKYKHLKFNPFA